MLMLTANAAMQEFTEMINLEAANRIKRRLELASEFQQAYNALVKAGVNCIPKEIGKHELDFGFTREVTHVRDWGKIHSAVGKLEVWDKQAITPIEDIGKKKRGKKKQLIRLIMTPMNEKLRGRVCFTIIKQLSEKDKCQVKVVRHDSVQVVCRVN